MLRKTRRRSAAPPSARWLAQACTPPTRWWRRLFGRGRAEVAAERAWLAALPFEVRNYEYLFLDETLHRFHWSIGLLFRDAEPDHDLLRDLFGNLASEASIGTTDYPGREERIPYAELALPPGIDTAWHRKWHMRVLFHRAVDEVLRPLHDRFPLIAVEPRNDHHFVGQR